MSRSCSPCRHTMPTGKRCGSPALRHENFCFYHHPTRRPATRIHASRTRFDLPPVTDAEDVQAILSEIIRRIADTTLDPRRAGLLLQTLQIARSNLSALPRYPTQESFTRESASSTARSALDLGDLSRLMADLSPHPTT